MWQAPALLAAAAPLNQDLVARMVTTLTAALQLSFYGIDSTFGEDGEGLFLL
jgi:hypothetical protein